MIGVPVSLERGDPVIDESRADDEPSRWPLVIAAVLLGLMLLATGAIWLIIW
jgi:hypothetical protein